MAARGDVRQITREFVVVLHRRKLVAQSDVGWIEPQLQDRKHALASLRLERLKRIDVARLEDQGLLADGMRTGA